MNRRQFIASIGIAATCTALPRLAGSATRHSIAGAIPPDRRLRAVWLA